MRGKAAIVIVHQWVKFSDDFAWPSSDYSSGVWVLAEIDEDGVDHCISLFGVEYTMSKWQVAEWGPKVERPL